MICTIFIFFQKNEPNFVRKRRRVIYNTWVLEAHKIIFWIYNHCFQITHESIYKLHESKIPFVLILRKISSSEWNNVLSSNVEIKSNHSQLIKKPSRQYSRLFGWCWRLMHECFPCHKSYIGNLCFQLLLVWSVTMKMYKKNSKAVFIHWSYWSLSSPLENIKNSLVFWRPQGL